MKHSLYVRRKNGTIIGLTERGKAVAAAKVALNPPMWIAAPNRKDLEEDFNARIAMFTAQICAGNAQLAAETAKLAAQQALFDANVASVVAGLESKV